MSVHSEVNNLFKNKSGNAPLAVRSRSGDTEDGNSYFDMRASGELSPFEVVAQSEQQNARKKFLLQYFTLLKERLNRFEFEYVRQLYAEGQAESVICENLGLNPKKFKRVLQKKLSASADDIAALVEASDWDDAELFSQCFLSAPQDIQDVNEINFLPKTVKGFGNLIERLAYRRYRKIYKAEWYKRRDGYTRSPSVRTVYGRKIKERVRSISALYRSMSYDFLFGAAAAFDLEPDREKLAGFERFYNSIYSVVMDCIQGLYQVVVDGVSIEDVEKAEQERYEERRRAFIGEDNAEEA